MNLTDKMTDEDSKDKVPHSNDMPTLGPYGSGGARGDVKQKEEGNEATGTPFPESRVVCVS